LRSSRVGMARPWSAARRRNCARAMAWKVPAVMPLGTPSLARRVRSSPAALRVKVTARVCSASSRPSDAIHAIRRVSTRVLPEPAPARMASGAARLVTASRWVGSRPRSSSLASVTRALYDPGVTPTRWRGRTRNGSRPRVVSAAALAGCSSDLLGARSAGARTAPSPGRPGRRTGRRRRRTCLTGVVPFGACTDPVSCGPSSGVLLGRPFGLPPPPRDRTALRRSSHRRDERCRAQAEIP